MSKRDYYEVLGLSKSASKPEIKKAYRKLAKEFHPDRNKSADAETNFKEVQEAYEILSDEQKRAAYDQYGFAGTQGFGGGANGGLGDFSQAFGGDMGNLEDLLQGFFGGSFGGFSQGGMTGRRHDFSGADLEVNIKIGFLEAVFGVEKTIQYKRLIVCDKCDGTGSKDGKTKTCPVCGGSGKETKVQRTILGAMQMVTTCSECHGVGHVIEQKCDKCHGKSVLEKEDELTINIPAGIPDGVTLRFNGKGNAGQFDAGFGDLYATIDISAHPTLERRGNDIYMEKEIDVTTAVLGGNVIVDSVHGDITMKVPAGTQSEKILRLNGKGGPRFKGNGNGDQYVKLIVKIPEKLSKEEKRLWEELRQLD